MLLSTCHSFLGKAPIKAIKLCRTPARLEGARAHLGTVGHAAGELVLIGECRRHFAFGHH